MNGDGLHELVRGLPGGDGAILDRTGRILAEPGGMTAMASKFLDLPGEQILVFHEDGRVEVWADRNARDSEQAKARYGQRFYRLNQAQTANGYNFTNLGGL